MPRGQNPSDTGLLILQACGSLDTFCADVPAHQFGMGSLHERG